MQPILQTSQGWLQPNSARAHQGTKASNSAKQNWQLLVTPWFKSTSLTQNDFWSSVVTCRNDDRVVFMVKGGTAKVNKPYCGVIYSPLTTFLNEDRGRQRIITVYFWQLNNKEIWQEKKHYRSVNKMCCKQTHSLAISILLYFGGKSESKHTQNVGKNPLLHKKTVTFFGGLTFALKLGAAANTLVEKRMEIDVQRQIMKKETWPLTCDLWPESE